MNNSNPVRFRFATQPIDKETLSPEHRKHREEIEQYPFSNNPHERYVAVLEGLRLDLLVNDPCWVVRHEAKRALKLRELEETGALSDEDAFNFYNYPVIDISDIAYSLYVEHMKSVLYSWASAQERWRDWAQNALLAFNHNEPMYSLDIWKADRISDDVEILPHSMFCGWSMPGCKGIYHQKRYIKQLLGNNKELLELYEADMRDFQACNRLRLGLDERLTDAHARSHGHTYNAPTSVEKGLMLE